LGDPARWAILEALGPGEPLMVRELAVAAGHSPSSTSKHLSVLRAAGLVVIGRAGLYQIPARFRPTDGERRLDFGRCVLRL
jgi:DNA-binding transcriptional ArsR family regulator